jgi:hypothetical protein
MIIRSAVAILIPVMLAVGQTMPYEGIARPRVGYVPDEKTAVKIAEAVLIPIYGLRRKSIRSILSTRS